MTLADLQPKDKRQVDGWIDDLVGALFDPIIVFPSPWQEDMPDWIGPQIKLERLIMNMKVMHESGVPVGDTEALAYIFPRTMESPISEQWLRIYMYVFNKAMAMKKVEVPEDLKSETLSNYDMQQLNDLKRFIYAKRVQHRKEKARTMKQETKEAKELEIKSAQPSFF